MISNKPARFTEKWFRIVLRITLFSLFLMAMTVNTARASVLHSRDGGSGDQRSTSEQGQTGNMGNQGERDDMLLAQDHFVFKRIRQIDLTRGTVRLPLYKGNANGKTVWYIITDASDFGIARDLNVNYAPKLANMGINCLHCVQETTITVPENNAFDTAIINFAGSPDFSPTRSIVAGPTGFPPKSFQPGAVGDALYSPFIRFQNSVVVYNTPIVATGDGPFDFYHHTNTGDRVVGIDLKNRTVDLLMVNGFDAGQRILYISTDSNSPVAAAIERATYVPALKDAPYPGGDDFIASARERIFTFSNGQTGRDNPQAQGLSNLLLDGNNALDATPDNTGIGKPLGNEQADPLNIQGDFPSLDDPRHANAYSPAWDLQIGEWTKEAIAKGLNTRQTDENIILKLVAQGYITGPGGAKYGSSNILINCPPVGFQDQRPAADLIPAPADYGSD
ncbi:hypothetical protein ccbrp13_29360 [Ktedonobacteria bacterium brp13]|nr:hypothetical protein ccbrp13_29360 [Ktedonobacteria bacterium brp13]